MVDSGKKKTFIDKLLIALKPRRNRTDIVDYAEKIIDDYTGVTMLRIRRQERAAKKNRAIVLWFLLSVSVVILWYTLKIFF